MHIVMSNIFSPQNTLEVNFLLFQGGKGGLFVHEGGRKNERTEEGEEKRTFRRFRVSTTHHHFLT